MKGEMTPIGWAVNWFVGTTSSVVAVVPPMLVDIEWYLRLLITLGGGALTFITLYRALVAKGPKT